jgi:hypothetical protein
MLIQLASIKFFTVNAIRALKVVNSFLNDMELNLCLALVVMSPSLYKENRASSIADMLCG